MLQYEEFLMESFPNVFEKYYREVEAATPYTIDKVKKKCINYLEGQCNGKYGFFAEAHNDSDKFKSNSIYMIPTSFDSALLLPYIMNEGIDKLVTDNIISVLKRSRRSSGFWNYFFDPEQRSFSLFPDDIDDTGVAAVALYFTENLSLSECQALGKKIIENRLVDLTTGAITTWIPDHQRKMIVKRYQKVPKLCAGCLTNFLWFMAIIGMDKEPEIIPSIDYVSATVDKLVGFIGNDSVELPGMCYYVNKYVIYFFISRFLEKSEYARNKFGRKFVDLIIDEFKLLVEKTNAEALDIACVILSMWHLKLLKLDEQNWITEPKEIIANCEIVKKLCDRLLTLQDKDGSFQAWKLYRWNRMGHWGGTKSITTGLVLAALGIAQREIYGSNYHYNGERK